MEVEPVQKGDHTGTVDMDLSFLVLIRICIFEQQLALVLLVNGLNILWPLWVLSMLQA